MLSAVLVAASCVLLVAATLQLWWMMHAWRTPETLRRTTFREPDGAHRHSFSLLVPARHEERVLGHTVEQMLRCEHTAFEIVLIVGHDDPGTAAIAHRLAEEHPARVRVVTDTHPVKNKPRAMNTALPHCRGDIVGVFDAEDVVHPELLTHVDAAFRATGGWDGDCLAEDCDLGVRLSGNGARTVVAYEAGLVTREETPDSLGGLFRQRTRWNRCTRAATGPPAPSPTPGRSPRSR